MVFKNERFPTIKETIKDGGYDAPILIFLHSSA